MERCFSTDALLDFTAQLPIRFTQGVLGLLPLGNIGDERLYDLTSAPLNSGQGHLQRYPSALRSATRPFETRAAVGHAFLNIFTAQHSGAFTIRLERGRSLAR